MSISASYTCQKCLSALKSAPRLKSSIQWSSRVSLGRREFSVGATRNLKHAGGLSKLQSSKIQPSENIIGRRAASSAGAVLKDEERALLQPNNLFHSFSNSPSPDIRRRAAFIKQNAYCPHPDHRQTRQPTDPDDPEARKSASGGLPPKHVSFECPDCGIPVSCSEEHWADDYEAHLDICDTLREINEDDHDLRSGRFFPEFEYPGDQIEEAMVNMTNWDTFLFSREFRAIDAERSLRQATRLLTYPITIGSVLHELSPYNIKKGGRLTVEGLKSLSGRLDH
jgi:splicing suppressor protein 51